MIATQNIQREQPCWCTAKLVRMLLIINDIVRIMRRLVRLSRPDPCIREDYALRHFSVNTESGCIAVGVIWLAPGVTEPKRQNRSRRMAGPLGCEPRRIVCFMW